MGRLSRDRLSRRVRPLHPEPRPPPARPLLPRAARRAAGETAARVCRRRGDRHPHPAGARLRRAPAAAASRGLAGGEAGEGDAGVVRRVRPARRRRAEPDGGAAERAPLPPRRPAGRRGAAPLPDAHDARPRDRDPVARGVRGRRSRRRDRQAGGQSLPAGQARDAQGEARAHGRLRGGRVPLAQERQGTRSARCCWDSTTTAASSSTSASRHRSRWRCAGSS